MTFKGPFQPKLFCDPMTLIPIFGLAKVRHIGEKEQSVLHSCCQTSCQCSIIKTVLLARIQLFDCIRRTKHKSLKMQQTFQVSIGISINYFIGLRILRLGIIRNVGH